MAKRLVCVLGGLSVSVAAIFPVVNRPNAQRSGDETERRKLKINEAIKQSRKLINRLKNEVGAPGIVVGVSVDGEQVWKEGLGYADIENEVEANEDTVMRIASISKCLTAAVVARLWQDGVIDIDKPVQSYVPTFPEKKFGKEKVTITTRLLMCHLSGIRHYSTMKKEESIGSGDGQLEEFYSKERYDSVEKALAIFKDDDLLYAPGSKFLYTTYGWTLVSAVMEGATGKTYPQIMRAFLRELGMRRTYLDKPEPIIYGRSRCYSKNKNGRVVNSPYVDNSCKWAGGGFLSTVGDLLQFSNALLFAFQRDGDIEVAKGSYKIMQNSTNTKNTPEIKSTGVESESVLQKVTSDFASGVGSITSGVVSGASSVWKNGYPWIWGGQSESSRKDNKDNNPDSVTTVKKSESVTQKVTSEFSSGVGSITSGAGSSGVSEDQNTTVKKSESVTQKVVSDFGSGVGSITSRVGSSGVSEDQSETFEKDKTVKKSESVTQKVVSDFGSGVGNITSGVGSSGVSEYQSETFEKDTTVKKSESVLEKVTSEFSSGVGSITSGVVSGASSVWKNGSSWIWGGQSETSEKDTTVKKSESVLEKVTSEFSSGVGSITSGVVSGASSVWKYGSSLVWSSEKEKDKESGNPFFSKKINREPYILPDTVAKLWTRVDGTLLSDWGPHVEGGYGLGFGIASPIDSPGGVIDGGQPYIVGHTGGAVGASSAMIIVPRKCNKEEPPKGIAVVLMCNLQSVSLNPLAIEIAKIFSL
ncbi:hypothetical protein J437_LFUL009632, partial [Ladona fulva]